MDQPCEFQVNGGSRECLVDRVADPLKRSTHFVLRPDGAYTHWLPRAGTNSVVKQFLLGGVPDQVPSPGC